MKKAASCGVIFMLIFFVVSFSRDAFSDAKMAKVQYTVAPEVQITNFEYYLDAKSKMERVVEKSPLTFKITVKNVSDKPYRFISRITLPDLGKSVGGFIPVKGEKDKTTGKTGPAVINPGKEKSNTYPMLHYEMPEVVEVEIITMEGGEDDD